MGEIELAKQKTNLTLRDFFQGKADSITALGVIDDAKVYSSEDYVELVKLEEQAKTNGETLGNHARVPMVDNQGMLTRTPRDKFVVNPAIAFANRIRVNKDDHTISVVTDYRAIEEQKNGMIYATSVVSYRIGKVDSGNYAVKSVENVTEQDFINQFTGTLNDNDAKLMLEVITHHQNTGTNTGLDLDSLFQ